MDVNNDNTSPNNKTGILYKLASPEDTRKFRVLSDYELEKEFERNEYIASMIKEKERGRIQRLKKNSKSNSVKSNSSSRHSSPVVPSDGYESRGSRHSNFPISGDERVGSEYASEGSSLYYSDTDYTSDGLPNYNQEAPSIPHDTTDNMTKKKKKRKKKIEKTNRKSQSTMSYSEWKAMMESKKGMFAEERNPVVPSVGMIASIEQMRRRAHRSRSLDKKKMTSERSLGEPTADILSLDLNTPLGESNREDDDNNNTMGPISTKNNDRADTLSSKLMVERRAKGWENRLKKWEKDMELLKSQESPLVDMLYESYRVEARRGRDLRKLKTVGTKVRARYRGGENQYSGVVTGVNEDGTVDVDYDDGDKEVHVPISYVVIQREEKKRGKRSNGKRGATHSESGSQSPPRPAAQPAILPNSVLTLAATSLSIPDSTHAANSSSTAGSAATHAASVSVPSTMASHHHQIGVEWKGYKDAVAEVHQLTDKQQYDKVPLLAPLLDKHVLSLSALLLQQGVLGSTPLFYGLPLSTTCEPKPSSDTSVYDHWFICLNSLYIGWRQDVHRDGARGTYFYGASEKGYEVGCDNFFDTISRGDAIINSLLATYSIVEHPLVESSKLVAPASTSPNSKVKKSYSDKLYAKSARRLDVNEIEKKQREEDKKYEAELQARLHKAAIHGKEFEGMKQRTEESKERRRKREADKKQKKLQEKLLKEKLERKKVRREEKLQSKEYKDAEDAKRLLDQKVLAFQREERKESMMNASTYPTAAMKLAVQKWLAKTHASPVLDKYSCRPLPCDPEIVPFAFLSYTTLDYSVQKWIEGTLSKPRLSLPEDTSEITETLRLKQMHWDMKLKIAREKNRSERTRSRIPRSIARMENRIAKLAERRRAKSAEHKRHDEIEKDRNAEKKKKHFQELMTQPLFCHKNTLLQELRAKLFVRKAMKWRIQWELSLQKAKREVELDEEEARKEVDGPVTLAIHQSVEKWRRWRAHASVRPATGTANEKSAQICASDEKANSLVRKRRKEWHKILKQWEGIAQTQTPVAIAPVHFRHKTASVRAVAAVLENRNGVEKVDEFSVGAKIEARYFGRKKYFLGVLAAINVDGSCNVDYDDGDKEENVPRNLIRILPKVEEPKPEKPIREFKLYDKVRAVRKGWDTLCPAVIVRVQFDGTFDIEYFDGVGEPFVKRDKMTLLLDSANEKGVNIAAPALKDSIQRPTTAPTSINIPVTKAIAKENSHVLGSVPGVSSQAHPSTEKTIFAPAPKAKDTAQRPESAQSFATGKVPVHAQEKVSATLKTKDLPPAMSSASSVVTTAPKAPLTLTIDRTVSYNFQVLKVHAFGLRQVEVCGRNDPYVVIEIKEAAPMKTFVRDNAGADASWDFTTETTFELSAEMIRMVLGSTLLDSKIRVCVYDKNKLTKDTLVGEGEVAVSHHSSYNNYTTKHDLFQLCTFKCNLLYRDKESGKIELDVLLSTHLH